MAWFTKCIENKIDSVEKWCYVQTQKNVTLFSNSTFQIFSDLPTYVKKLNYPSIWLKKMESS